MDEILSTKEKQSIIKKGEKNSQSKLKDEQVLELRREYSKKPFNVRKRSKKIGISHVTLSLALKGKSFRHIPEPVNEIKKFAKTGKKYRIVDLFLTYHLRVILKWERARVAEFCKCHIITVSKRLSAYDKSKYYIHKKKFVEKYKDKSQLL